MVGHLSFFQSSSIQSSSPRSLPSNVRTSPVEQVPRGTSSGLELSAVGNISAEAVKEDHPLFVGEIPKIIMEMTAPFHRDILAQVHVTFDEHFQKNRPDTMDAFVSTSTRDFPDAPILEQQDPLSAAHKKAQLEIKAMIAPESSYEEFLQVFKTVNRDVHNINALRDHRIPSRGYLQRESFQPISRFIENGEALPGQVALYRKQLNSALYKKSGSDCRECLLSMATRISCVQSQASSTREQVQSAIERLPVCIATFFIPMISTTSALKSTTSGAVVLGASCGAGCGTTLLLCVLGAGIKKATDACYEHQVNHFQFKPPVAPQAQSMAER